MTIIILYFAISIISVYLLYLKIAQVKSWVVADFGDHEESIESKIKNELIKKQIKYLDTYSIISFVLFVLFLIIFAIIAISLIFKIIQPLDFMTQVQKIISTIANLPLLLATVKLFMYCNTQKNVYIDKLS